MLSNENRDIQRHGKYWAHDTKGRQIKQKHLYSPVKALSVIEKRKSLRKKVIDSLSFEIWIFRNGQPDCDDDRRIIVTMNST